MINLLGIFVAILISQGTRGQGVLVGPESLAAALLAIPVVLFFHNSVASHVIDRWHLVRLRLAAAEQQGMAEYARELSLERESLLRRAPAMRLGTDVLVLGMYLLVCFVFGWPDYVAGVLGVPQYLNLLPDMLPYLGMLAATWIGQWRMERAMRGVDWSLSRFAMFNARANLMTLAPILLIYTAYWALTTFVPVVNDLRQSFEFIEVAAQMTLVLVVMAFVPVVVRMVLPSSKLPDGRLRRRLETFARDRGIRVNQILVWRTGGGIFATAFVIGLITPFRYVFITDALLKRMTEDEILAVFAHELGHVKHRHLYWLLAFILSFTVVMLGVVTGANLLAPGGSYEFFALALVVLYGYFVFGYISRRFERQADAFAAEHTSPELLASVFLKLGASHPHLMRKHGWRHFSLERRVRELVLARAHPEVNRIFRAELVRGIAIAIGATLLGALLLIKPVRNDVVTGLATYSLNQYDRERAKGADTARVKALREKTLERSAAMARLGGEFEPVADWYAGIVAELSGEDTTAFDKLIAKSEAELERATGTDQRREIEAWQELYRHSKAAAARARQHGTTFTEEFEKERKR
ncbi:MAG: M48 family metalloprotease [Planctomycetes bacterium]|nr:M48 family metalloprotease [Planctomycetota bacterium]MCW8136515.1 M48 family metalloprotease [Planctomycetota bacterium]